MKSVCIAENKAERERLKRLAGGLSEADLRLEMPNGWSFATKLLHLAFWDYYALGLLRRWKDGGVTVSSLDVDAVNGAVRELGRLIPGQAVLAAACSAAEAVDREVEGIGAELARAIEAAGRPRILHRAVHRREHLDQIEAAIRSQILPITQMGKEIGD
jgi:hypothetical protein